MFWGFDGSNPIIPTGDQILIWTFAETDNWNTSVLQSGSSTPWPVPLAGWYLVEGFIGMSTATAAARLGMGFQAVINGNAAANFNGGSQPNTTVTPPTGHGAGGSAGADLFQLNPFESDTLSWYAFVTVAASASLTSFNLGIAEWVALPTSGLTNYTGPYGTTVSSPVFASAFPSGPGTTTTGSVAVGAVSITVADATGMVVGGTLGLDFINGVMYKSVAEAVSITSVAGTTIGISATAFPHAQGAPVAVPYSAAFLNQQVRDAVRYLAYPPFCRLQCNSAQSIPSIAIGSFPPTVGGNPSNQIVHFTSGGVTGQPAADNFSGSSASGYTVPVSGVYFVYGHISFAGSSSTTYYAAGISVNGGTIQWGTMFRGAGGTLIAQCPTVRRHLRLTAGQTITLWGFQSSGAAMNTNAANNTDNSRLICLWRST